MKRSAGPPPACNPLTRRCIDRRKFLLTTATGAGAGVSTVLLGDLFGSTVLAQDAGKKVRLASYPEKRIGSLSALVPDEPVPFLYPHEEAHSVCFVLKLGARAGGGVGPKGDVVAFSSYCTHQGGLLTGNYDAGEKVIGPCPIHLSAFDLRRHGIVTAGQATEDLPQVVLEARRDDLYAVGVIGLIYGYAANVGEGA